MAGIVRGRRATGLALSMLVALSLLVALSVLVAILGVAVVAALVRAALRARFFGGPLGVLVLDLGGLRHAWAALAFFALWHVDLHDMEHVVGDLLRRIG